MQQLLRELHRRAQRTSTTAHVPNSSAALSAVAEQLRKSFRGERGWRSSLGQMHALSRRIIRAGRGEWGELWQEALAVHSARENGTDSKFPHPAQDHPVPVGRQGH